MWLVGNEKNRRGALSNAIDQVTCAVSVSQAGADSSFKIERARACRFGDFLRGPRKGLDDVSGNALGF
jgi:hypothetical protein